MPRWSAQANDIFLTAIDIATAAERAAYVQRACGNDAELREAVDQLLAAADRASMAKFLETPPDIAAHDTQRSTESPGTIVGSYKLLEVLGEGGFGTVYLAEQQQPVQRQVAVKIIKPGMDSAHVIARFEAERQALAVMDHPNIAKVHDAGTTDAGRPYFVMELVRGVSITRYCDQERLSPQQRLELFIPVCQAVQHAHQKGVIHRDLKPSNIIIAMYDGRPVPKVIDFGVAKAVGQKFSEQSVHTELGGIIGTLEYMSPEQAEPNNRDVDTRADIYSLGVILYELLAGAPPFTAAQLRGAAFDQMLRMIREVEPAKPSTRLSSSDELPAIAARRRLEPKRLTRTIHGELDWIVMKALEKDRARRYETANGLAADLQRYLSDEPIAAGPPSRLYRARKFLNRHKFGVAASTTIALLLVGGVVATTVGLIREARQRRIADEQRALAIEQQTEAQRQAGMARGVNEFLIGMLSSADPNKLLGDKVTVLQAIQAAESELDGGKFKDHPQVEAAIRQAIGQTLRSLGRYDRAEPNLHRALELRRNSSAGKKELADALGAMGNLLADQGKLAEAEQLFAEALSIERAARSDVGDDVRIAKAMQNVAWVMSNQGKQEQAIAMLREALAIHRAVRPVDKRALAAALSHLGLALWRKGLVVEAEPLLREALEIHRRVSPSGHPDLASSLSNLALALQNLDRHPDAEILLRESLEISRRALPEGHPDLSVPMNNLASTLKSQSKLADAEALYRESLAIRRASSAVGGPDVSRSVPIATSLTNLADVLRLQNRLPEAQALMLESLEIFRAALPADHPTIGTALTNLGWVYLDQNLPADAEPLLREALTIKRKALPVAHPEILSALGGLAFALQRQGKFAEAEPLLLEAETVVRGTNRHPRSVQFLAALYTEWDKSEPGKGYEEKARQWRGKLPATRSATNPS